MGFYGNRLKVNAAVTGAWGPFGPDRLVTKAKGNVPYELDGRSALGMYKMYLGEYASELPASGLFFPLLCHSPGSDRCVLRAPIGVDESERRGSDEFVKGLERLSFLRRTLVGRQPHRSGGSPTSRLLRQRKQIRSEAVHVPGQ